jgi:hypothetical protein
MAKRKKLGDGITEYEVSTYEVNDPDFAAHFKEFVDRWNALPGNDFDKAVYEFEVLCKSILDRAGVSYDSPEDGNAHTMENIARRFISELDFVRKRIKANDVVSASANAFDLGRMIGVFSMKFMHEINALKGRKFQSGKRKGSIKETTKYLTDLIEKNPGRIYKELYDVALQDAESGDSPFGFDHAGGGMLLDNNGYVTLESFIKRASKANPKKKDKKT